MFGACPSRFLRAACAFALAGPTLGAADASALPGPAPERPRLVLLVAVDQLRWDYLVRFREGFRGGFARLLAGGAVFTNAQLEHYPTVTAVGHAVMLSGAPPAASGIVGNDWYDRQLGRNVTSVEDAATALLGAEGTGSSPHRLLVSTLGDELKLAGRGSRVVGLSLKDRSAILMAGRMADAAYWWHTPSGRFVSSTYYRPRLPEWVEEFNRRRPADAYASREWRAEGSATLLRRLPDAAGPELYAGVFASEFGNELLGAFALAALEGEDLGRPGSTDVLALSFSSNDSVGHAHGPDSEAVEQVTLATDRVLGELLDAVERRLGAGHTLVVLTSDHGVAPVPEQAAARRLSAGRMRTADIVDRVEAGLAAAFGPGRWIAGTAGSALYLDHALIEARGLDPAQVRHVAARATWSVPRVARVYTREQLLAGDVPRDPWSARVQRSYHPHRSGDVEILLEPYWIRSPQGTTHGSPYSYDAHVPLVLSGPWFRPGLHQRAVALDDLAPTLATLLEVEMPSGSAGRVLVEALASARPKRP
jgi:predicted AlkP superfamily pyrophosphatase or phosphodiesterase